MGGSPVVARAGYVLDGMSLTGAEDKCQVQAALDELLDLVALAGLHRRA